MKKGLGRIPKSLSWIDIDEPITPAETFKEVTIKKPKAEPAEAVAKAAPTESKTTQKGLPSGWTRATFIVEQSLNEKLKAIAYWDRLTVKEVMHEALTQYMQDRNVKPIPKR